jgi:predicted RNA-binding protein Jag
MNSIMQEAPSLAKAIEQAWIKAGKPQKFSIRVFEDAEKNFLGFSKKPAKIALLFEKDDIAHKPEPEARKKEARPQSYTQTQQQPRRQDTQRRPQQTASQQPQPNRVVATKQTPPVSTLPTGQLPRETSEEGESSTKIFWTDEMVAIANNWLKDALEKMDKKDLVFSSEVKRYHLKFSFSKPLIDDPEKQKNLFRNYAFLIMQTVRNRLKKQLKYHKIVLTCDQH